MIKHIWNVPTATKHPEILWCPMPSHIHGHRLCAAMPQEKDRCGSAEQRSKHGGRAEKPKVRKKTSAAGKQEANAGSSSPVLVRFFRSCHNWTRVTPGVSDGGAEASWHCWSMNFTVCVFLQNTASDQSLLIGERRLTPGRTAGLDRGVYWPVSFNLERLRDSICSLSYTIC